MITWPVPATVRALRAFLGLTGFYRRFIRGYAQIAAPLTDLLGHSGFSWNAEAEAAFTSLKAALSSTPVLALPDFTQLFTVESDASGVGIGAVLTQNGHPIAYFSKKLVPRMQAASTYYREMFAITSAVRKWRHYLLGRRFVVLTDQRSLRELMGQTIQTPEQQFWLAKLVGFDFEIRYRPGRENSVADALSRREAEGQLFAISGPVAGLLDELRVATTRDPSLQPLLCTSSPSQGSNSRARPGHGLVWWGRRVVVPNDVELRRRLIKEFHDTPVGGHAGCQRTYRRIASEFYWRGLRNDVDSYIRDCLVCQQVKYPTQAPAGLLQPLPIPHRIWEDISMDFITGLPMSDGKSTILVVVDRLSKYAHFIPMPSGFTSVSVAETFAKEVIRLHGFPRTIVSDRDRVFVSSFWRELFRLQGTTLAMSSAYHPETDGQTEVTNRTLEMYLRCFVADHPRRWVSFVPWAEYSYNTAVHSATDKSPFEIVYGRPPPSLIRYSFGDTAVEAIEHDCAQRDRLLQDLRSHLKRTQQSMKAYADRRRSDIAFEVGTWVWVRLQPYRQQSVRKRLCQKLGRRFFGPFRIAARIGAVAYRVELPPDARVHPVFHVSRLKRFHGTLPTDITPLPPTDIDGRLLLQPVGVGAERHVHRSGHSVQQVLVQWASLPPSEATWEDVGVMRREFPNINLEDKVPLSMDGRVDVAQRRKSTRVTNPPKRLEDYVKA